MLTASVETVSSTGAVRMCPLCSGCRGASAEMTRMAGGPIWRPLCSHAGCRAGLAHRRGFSRTVRRSSSRDLCVLRLVTARQLGSGRTTESDPGSQAAAFPFPVSYIESKVTRTRGPRGEETLPLAEGVSGKSHCGTCGRAERAVGVFRKCLSRGIASPPM